MDTDLINTNIEYEVKYGHGEGHTDCDFNPSGGFVSFCGFVLVQNIISIMSIGLF